MVTVLSVLDYTIEKKMKINKNRNANAFDKAIRNDGVTVIYLVIAIKNWRFSGYKVELPTVNLLGSFYSCYKQKIIF